MKGGSTQFKSQKIIIISKVREWGWFGVCRSFHHSLLIRLLAFLNVFINLYVSFVCQITTCTRDGINRISLAGCDARAFCVGVRIIKRRTVQQVTLIHWI